MQEWHTLTIDETCAQVNVEAGRGLTAEEAVLRLERHGANELVESGGRRPLAILWEQVTATMVLILLAAAAVSAVLGKWHEAAAILAIVVLFALLGFVQEYRAERAMAALKRMAVPLVRVRRGGMLADISARELVPGDVVLLEAGNIVPADLRLCESANLRVQEAALTGESEAVEKETAALAGAELPLGDRRNMAYMGTIISYGRGTGLVVESGMATELGKIAALLQREGDEMTPLQRRLDQAGKVLAWAGSAVAVVLAGVDILQGGELVNAFLLAVSVAVAVIPEGLPAVVTITLALGARRMLARNALIRRLPAVETLGSVTTICSDKTGTLTENRMTVTVLDVAGVTVSISGEDAISAAQLVPENAGRLAATPQGGLALLLSGGALCNDASLQAEGDGGAGPQSLGDPTEAALVVAAARHGLRKDQLDLACPRVAELPFDSDRKRMTTVQQLAGEGTGFVRALLGAEAAAAAAVSWTKGAVDGLLDQADWVWVNGAVQAMNDEFRQRIETANHALAAQGMRVLGLGFRILPELPVRAEETLEKNLIFLGFFGIIDPPRAEVREAVGRCRQAGIRPVMITGDHPLTAMHIARELDIAGHGERVLTGVELQQLDDAGLDRLVDEVAVYARVAPEHKLRIVESLRRRGHIIAMTGDGVNDAPALKSADIGVAMGITGTDVAKEAANMVLRDDNFSTIVAAVEEGRVIYDNLRKFIKFSLGGNIGKILVMILGVFCGMPTPLLPLQLLWLNLLTDGLLGVGLGMEPAERGVMRRKPFSPKAGIFSQGVGGQTVRIGLVIGLVSLGLGLWYFKNGHPHWQTMLFNTLAFAQIWQALGTRSGGDSLFRAGLFSNPVLLGLVLSVGLLQGAAMYLPFLQRYLQTSPLSPTELLLSCGLSIVVFIYAECEKLVLRPRA
ncbi:MAG: ATPase [Desulfobulbaceae bacterium A2]|nr:MAG: ATPase [Desulfobulbaceae bacterium A2]